MPIKQTTCAFIMFPLLVLLSAAAWWCITTHRHVADVLQMMHEQERHLQKGAMGQVVKLSIESYCKSHVQETEEALATTGTLEAQVSVDAYNRRFKFHCVVVKQESFVVTVRPGI